MSFEFNHLAVSKKKLFTGFTLYGHGSHVGCQLKIFFANFKKLAPRILHMLLELNLPGSF